MRNIAVIFCGAVCLLICLGAVNAGDVALITSYSLKVDAIGKNSAKVSWIINRTRFFMDVGLGFAVTYRGKNEGNQRCTVKVTSDTGGITLTGLDSKKEYVLSVLPYCVAGNWPNRNMPKQEPKFKDSVNQSCDKEDCYARSMSVNFKTL